MEGQQSLLAKGVESGVECVVQEEWLKWIRIHEEIDPRGVDSDSSSSPSSDYQILMSPKATITDLKKEVFRIRGHNPAFQRFQNIVSGEHVFGAILSNVQQPIGGIEYQLRLIVRPLDPLLESLYQITFMGNVEDRDRMMNQLSTHRDAGTCPCGGLESVGPGRSPSCTLCGALAPSTCLSCRFSLCSRCIDTDGGRPRSLDPYDSLASLAKLIGAELACCAAWAGSQGYFSGYPSIFWRPQWGDIKPPAFETFGIGSIGPDCRVIPDGTRVVLRLGLDILDLLLKSGRSFPQPPDPVESRVYPGGATVKEICCLRDNFRASESWQVIANRLMRDHQLCSANRSTGDVATFYNMSLVTFDVGEVVFELVEPGVNCACQNYSPDNVSDNDPLLMVLSGSFDDSE